MEPQCSPHHGIQGKTKAQLIPYYQRRSTHACWSKCAREQHESIKYIHYNISRCSEYNKVLATQTITMKQILYCHLDKNSLTRRGCRNYPAASVCAFCCQELLRSRMVVHIGHYTKLLPFGHYRCYVECYRLVTSTGRSTTGALVNAI